MKSFSDLVNEGDKQALQIQTIMESPDYLKMNGSAENKQARAVVTAFFQSRFGTGPAEGSIQNNRLSRGRLGDVE